MASSQQHLPARQEPVRRRIAFCSMDRNGSRDGAQRVGNGRILRGNLIDIADLDIGRHHAGPLGACAEKPPATPDHLCRVEGIAWNEKLHTIAGPQIRTDDDALGRAVGVQENDFERIPEILISPYVVAHFY